VNFPLTSESVQDGADLDLSSNAANPRVMPTRRASSRDTPLQNEYFSENWINRGVPTVEVIGANPPAAETEAEGGFANDA